MRIAAVLFASALIFSAAYANAGSPTLVPVQGVLTDGAGISVNGVKSIKFSLYASENGGSPVWMETQSVAVTDGFFSVYMGDDTALDLVLFKNNSNLWLGVQVDSEAEQTPRTYLGTGPYTAFAEYCGNLPAHTHPFSDITGSLAGDVTGTPTGTMVGGINGVKVSDSTPATGEHLRFDGAIWTPDLVALATDVAGILPTSNYSAYNDLGAEGYLNNDSGVDLLTRDQCDARYSLTTHNHAGVYAAVSHSHDYPDLPTTVARTNQDNNFTVSQTMPRANFTALSGTAPFSVTSFTLVSNLNSDMLDGYHATNFAASAHTHSASDLVSGVLQVARGGTGSSTQNFMDLTTEQTASGVKTFNTLALGGDADARNNVIKNPVLGMLQTNASFYNASTSGTVTRYDGLAKLTAAVGTPAWVQDQPGGVMIDDLFRKGNYMAANVLFSSYYQCGGLTNYVLFGGSSSGSVSRSFGFKTVGNSLYGVVVSSSGVQTLTPVLETIICQGRYRLLAVVRAPSLVEFFVNGVSRGTLANSLTNHYPITGYTIRAETDGSSNSSEMSVNMLTVAQPF